MTTICKKCTHCRQNSGYQQTGYLCYAKWETRTINRVTGRLEPDAWDCADKNPAVGPCPHYEPLTWSIGDLWRPLLTTFLILVIIVSILELIKIST